MRHAHNEHTSGSIKGGKLGLSILLNLFITLSQIWGGIISGSLSLLSDAVHNFSDVIALFISYIADKLTKSPYTRERTFGYKRAEVIAALINASSLLVIAILLTKEAVLRLQQPVAVESVWVIFLAGASILVNGGSVLLLKHDAQNNINIRSAYLHLLTDMFTSIAVLLGGVMIYYFQVYWLDSILSIMIAIYLCLSAAKLLGETLKMLMQFSPKRIDLDALEKSVLQEEKIKNLHHVHIWQLNDQETHFEAHINFKKDLLLSQVSEITLRIKNKLWDEFNIQHILLQPEIGTCYENGLIVDESGLVSNCR